MGSKNRPGIFDCLKSLKPGEPVFILTGEDAEAADIVEVWAIRAKAGGCNLDKVNEAYGIAVDMRLCEHTAAEDFDDYMNLDPEMPFFVLRGQDELSDALVDLWAERATHAHYPPELIAAAHKTAEDMVAWPHRKQPD